DRERYQTVYAAHDGSVAAPTAGLHFTRALLDRMRNQDVALAEVDLHVGPGTFKAVETDELEHHRMHTEPYRVSDRAAGIINARRAAGGRVGAVGTTVVRTRDTLARRRARWRRAPGRGGGSLRVKARPGSSFALRIRSTRSTG